MQHLVAKTVHVPHQIDCNGIISSQCTAYSKVRPIKIKWDRRCNIIMSPMGPISNINMGKING